MKPSTTTAPGPGTWPGTTTTGTTTTAQPYYTTAGWPDYPGIIRTRSFSNVIKSYNAKKHFQDSTGPTLSQCEIMSGEYLGKPHACHEVIGSTATTAAPGVSLYDDIKISTEFMFSIDVNIKSYPKNSCASIFWVGLSERSS